MHPLSIAPMMDRTDRHFRWFLRQISRRVLLYTEMVVTRALLHGDRHRFLDFDPEEHPISLQLGGDDPRELATCAQLAEDWGYDEVNINVGCPSPRVRRGCFGVVLMKHPERVAAAVHAMRAAVSIPVTVKHRIGVDDLDAYEDMLRFVDVVSEAGPARFTVHARKAWLEGLSPKENRNIPPLRYADVHRLKRERPEQCIEINGGICDLDAVQRHLQAVDAVMIGRGAWSNPWMLAEADRRIYGDEHETRTRRQVAMAMAEYIARQSQTQGFKVHHATRGMLNLFAGQPGSRRFKQVMSHPVGPQTIRQALEQTGQPPVPRNLSASSRNKKLKVVRLP